MQIFKEGKKRGKQKGREIQGEIMTLVKIERHHEKTGVGKKIMTRKE